MSCVGQGAGAIFLGRYPLSFARVDELGFVEDLVSRFAKKGWTLPEERVPRTVRWIGSFTFAFSGPVAEIGDSCPHAAKRVVDEGRVRDLEARPFGGGGVRERFGVQASQGARSPLHEKANKGNTRLPVSSRCGTSVGAISTAGRAQTQGWSRSPKCFEGSGAWRERDVTHEDARRVHSMYE